MSEKVYVLNVYNTMTGQYELIQVTNSIRFHPRHRKP